MDPHTTAPTQAPPDETSSFMKLVLACEKIFADARQRRAAHEERSKSKDLVFLTIAKTVALLGTCCRLKVGCVLLDQQGKVVGMGYNGAGPGMDHCHSDTCNSTCRCRRTRHAEKNALSNCSGTPHTAYLTHEPCSDCAKDIIAEGVRRVVFAAPYTSISEEERAARQEWIDFYKVQWQHLDLTTETPNN